MADPQTPPAKLNGASRDAVLAEMSQLKDAGDIGTANAKPAKPKTAPTGGAPAAPIAQQAAPLEGEPTEAEQPAEPDAEPEPEREQIDPDTQRRLDMVTRAEKRQRQQIAEERTKLEDERRRFVDEQRAARTELESFARLKARAKYDAIGVMRSLGLTDDDLEPAAQQIYAHSKAGASDPKRREAAERAMRERQSAEDVAELRARLDKYEQRDAESAKFQTAAEQGRQYFEKLGANVSAETTPLVHRQIEKNPQRAYDGLVAVVRQMVAEGDEDPDPAHVVRLYEKRRRAELEDEGVDIEALLGKKTAAPANGNRSSRTLGQVASATRPKNSSSVKRAPNGTLDDDFRQSVLAEMATLDDSDR